MLVLRTRCNMGRGGIANLLPEHLLYWQNIRMGPRWGFLPEFTGTIEMSKLFSGFPSFAFSRFSEVPFHEPRTECHPSFSSCSGRLPSVAGKPSGLWNSSKVTSAKLHTLFRLLLCTSLGEVKKKKQIATHIFLV